MFDRHDLKCYTMLAYLSAQKIWWPWHDFSAHFGLSLWKCWTRIDPSLATWLAQQYWRCIAKSTCIFLSHLTWNLATPELLRLVTTHTVDNTWYQYSFAIGLEIHISLSANSLKCKYYPIIFPPNYFTSIILFIQKNLDFHSADLWMYYFFKAFFYLCFFLYHLYILEFLSRKCFFSWWQHCIVIFLLVFTWMLLF